MNSQVFCIGRDNGVVDDCVLRRNIFENLLWTILFVGKDVDVTVFLGGGEVERFLPELKGSQRVEQEVFILLIKADLILK